MCVCVLCVCVCVRMRMSCMFVHVCMCACVRAVCVHVCLCMARVGRGAYQRNVCSYLRNLCILSPIFSCEQTGVNGIKLLSCNGTHLVGAYYLTYETVKIRICPYMVVVSACIPWCSVMLNNDRNMVCTHDDTLKQAAFECHSGYMRRAWWMDVCNTGPGTKGKKLSKLVTFGNPDLAA